MQPDELRDAATAIDTERRHRKRAVDVAITSARAANPSVYAVAIESDVPIDPRGWAGALLVRSLTDTTEAAHFSSQILEADADEGMLYVEVSPGAQPPTPGRCQLWPFDFLGAPWKLLHEPGFLGRRPHLLACLRAAAGELELRRVGGPPGVLPALHWSWSAVWGPPGTGKTYTLVRQAAALLQDSSERVLLVSNTNQATDKIALDLGTHLRERGTLHGVARLGRVASPAAYREAGLDALLPWSGSLEELVSLTHAVDHADTHEERAIAGQVLELARASIPKLSQRLLDPDLRCVVTTLHGALGALVCTEALHCRDRDWPPFTTVILDEASLVGRLQTAAVATLASRRVVLVGDPCQLSPIASAARSMPRAVLRWLARSGLDRPGDTLDGPHVHHLTQQHRMHPDIRRVVSAYAYADRLDDAPARAQADWPVSRTLARQPRAIWYVIDEHTDRRAALSSQRGPGGKSRERPLIDEVLGALFDVHPELVSLPGLFVSPYVAQCGRVDAWLREQGAGSWKASTIHAQQGSEADVVVFDVVHASSTAWPIHEWRRLVNVALSRARELVVLVASRAEMEQVWLRSLVSLLTPRVITRRRGAASWVTLTPAPVQQAGLFGGPPPPEPSAIETEPLAAEPDPLAAEPAEPHRSAPPQPQPSPRRSWTSDTLGSQLRERKRLIPMMSAEQARLVHRDLHDAGPRLVRGVAGSGKTLVLARWVVRALHGFGVADLDVVYANAALRQLLAEMIDDAWNALRPVPGPTPWDRIHLHHVGVLLGDLLTDAGQPPPGRGGDASAYDYESQARRILDSGHLTPRFPALFIDEAQDFGHDTLALLIALTEPGPEQRRPVMIFYDNAQDIYGRGTPRWADLGLDLRGRSDVMRESFRSTRANTELALEVLDRLRPLRQSPDLRELMRAGPGGTPPLLAHEHGRWRARFCVAEGQPPEVRILPDRDAELRLVTRQVYKWIVEDGVPPGDIRILALKNTRDAITHQLDQALGDHGRVVQRRSEGFVGCDDAVVVTTPHSFKGHDAELIVVVGVDGYVTSGRPLHAVLYVAMTRARTLLLVTGTTSSLPGSASDQVITAVRDAADAVGSLHTEPLDPRLPA